MFTFISPIEKNVIRIIILCNLKFIEIFIHRNYHGNIYTQIDKRVSIFCFILQTNTRPCRHVQLHTHTYKHT